MKNGQRDRESPIQIDREIPIQTLPSSSGKEYQSAQDTLIAYGWSISRKNYVLLMRVLSYVRASGERPREERHSTRSNNA